MQEKPYKILPISSDQRGIIADLLPGKKITSVLYITSKKGSVRANHYHKKDSHYMYVIKGKMQYVYKPVAKTGARKHSLVVNEGEIIYTPPMLMHAVKFLQNTQFLALTTEKRDQKTYENDIVRVNLV